MYVKKMCAVTHSDPKIIFYHVRLSISASVRPFVVKQGLKFSCLSQHIQQTGETTLKRISKTMTLQEDACSVASFVEMNVLCVQNSQTRPQKTALNIKNTWIPKKLSSEVTCCRRLVEVGNGHGDRSQGLLFLLAFLLQKCISDLSCVRGNLSFWSTGLDFHFPLTLGTLC